MAPSPGYPKKLRCPVLRHSRGFLQKKLSLVAFCTFKATLSELDLRDPFDRTGATHAPFRVFSEDDDTRFTKEGDVGDRRDNAGSHLTSISAILVYRPSPTAHFLIFAIVCTSSSLSSSPALPSRKKTGNAPQKNRKKERKKERKGRAARARNLLSEKRTPRRAKAPEVRTNPEKIKRKGRLYIK